MYDKERGRIQMKDWEVAQILGQLIVAIRNRRKPARDRVDDLVSLELLLDACAESPRYGKLAACYKDTKREGILTYDVKAVEHFVGQMLLTFPSPALQENNVTIRTLVEADGERKLYEGIGICLITEEVPTPKPLFGAGIDPGDGMVGYVGYLGQRGKGA